MSKAKEDNSFLKINRIKPATNAVFSVVMSVIAVLTVVPVVLVVQALLHRLVVPHFDRLRKASLAILPLAFPNHSAHLLRFAPIEVQDLEFLPDLPLVDLVDLLTSPP